MTPPRRGLVRPHANTSSGAGRESTDLALAAGGALLLIMLLLWAGAALACITSGRGVPDGGLPPAVLALTRIGAPSHAWPHQQLPGPLLYWGSTAFVFAAATAIAVTAAMLVRRFQAILRPEVQRVRSLPGLATPSEAEAAAGRKTLLRRAGSTRPSLAGTAHPSDIGYRLGTTKGRQLWCSVEDSALVVGPPRMGKGLHIVIPWVLDAPGPVVTTSTRPDTLTLTLNARRRRGAVAVFDPQRLAGLPGGLRWSPVRGCDSPRVALVRARGLAAGVGFGRTVSDSDFWTGQTETALRCLLHAAALDERGAMDLYRWSLNAVLAEEAITILNRQSSAAAPGWADALEAIVHCDPRTRDSVWLGVRQSLAALADPDVLDAVNPSSENAFDPASFLEDSGTLFLLASAVASGSCAPLVAAFVEDITETARSLAGRSTGSRLDAPLLLALDEIANLTPLPSLPALMAEGGGSGITTLAVLQSLAQARHRWGEHAADSIWDAATMKIVLGGLAKYRDLEDIARLLGEIDEDTQTISHGRAGERSSSTGVRRVPVMPPSVLRTLPFGTGVLLLRHARPAVIDLQPWPDRPDATELRNGRVEVESLSAGSNK